MIADDHAVVRAGIRQILEAELSVRDESPGHSTVRWSSTFEPSGGSEADATAVISGVYQAGFDSLKKMFGG